MQALVPFPNAKKLFSISSVGFSHRSGLNSLGLGKIASSWWSWNAATPTLVPGGKK
jgi:hypothetical protein